MFQSYLHQFAKACRLLSESSGGLAAQTSSERSKTLPKASEHNSTERYNGHPTRKYLWIRRPVRRSPNSRVRHLQSTFVDIKPVRTVVIFGSLITVALCLALFVH